MTPLTLLLTSLLTPALAGSLGSSPAPTALDAVYAPRRVALLVGVDRYADPALTPLRFAAKDARDLAAVLGAPQLGDFDEVIVVTGPEATTRAGIEAALASATAGLQRDDTFVLYLSGHGTLTLDARSGSELWFLPSDGALGDARRTGISVAWLESRVAEVEARRRVLIMDTCHNGRDKSSLAPDTQATLAAMRGEAPPPRVLREVSESEARLYAAQYHQPAMEDPTLQNGVYTHFLIQALSDAAGQADLDRDGLVDVTEAHDWARDRTIAFTQGMQVPRAEYRIVGREDIYLAGDGATRSTAERALLAATDALLASARVYVNGEPRGVLPQVVPLDPGRHRLEVRDADDEVLIDRHLRVSAGETVMVEDLLPQRATTLEAGLGVGLRHGYGDALVHPRVGVLDLTLHAPGLGPAWLAPDLHLAFTYNAGALELTDLGQPLTVHAGELTAGLGAGYAFSALPLTLGPTLDMGALYRQVTELDGTPHLQGGLLLAPGARASLRHALSDNRSVFLRYDLRLLPFTYAREDWTSVVHHGLVVGLGASP